MAGVKIADTLSRFGSGKYPLVIATDINLSDGTNLQEYLDDLLLKIVQADWEQSDTTAIDYIKNKPIIPVLTDLIDDEAESDETTYSSNKIKALINAIEAGIKFEIVEELPSEDIDTHTIYLVPREEENDNNGYDEYLYINDRWELIGSTYIDLSNYYTKSDVDGLLANKQDNLSQQQLAVLNSGITSEKVSTYDGYATTKVDKVEGKGLSTNDFTDEDKAKLDSAISTLPIASEVRLGTVKIGDNLVIDENGTLSAVNTGVTSYSPLSDKPSINNVELNGNKTLNDLGIDIPTATSDLINDSNFVSDSNYVHTDNNFTNALKDKLTNIVADIIDDVESSLSTTYSSSKIDALINSIVGGMNIEIVQELPSSGEEHTIYLVPKQDASTGDVYNEYIYIDSKWELIGNTQIDLSDYYTKQEVDSALSGKVDKVSGKGLSTEDYSSVEKTKLGNIESGAEVNVINNIKLNGNSQTITNKEIDLRVQELPSGGATGQSLVKSSASDYDVEWANTENVQLSELPTITVDINGKIYQYVGTDETVYKTGHFYKAIYTVKKSWAWGSSDIHGYTLQHIDEIKVGDTFYQDINCTTVYGTVTYIWKSKGVIQVSGSYGSPHTNWANSSHIIEEDIRWEEVNAGADIKVNGIAQQFANGSYDIPVPTKTSDLDNDSDYVTLNDFLIDNQVSENTTYSSSKIESLVSSGGGHTIQDYESTDMTARTNLQFGESLNVTDDSENNATVVDEYELTNADIEEILSELPSPLSGSNKGCIPCGKVEAFYRETAPDGYLACDGTEYAKADYPKLASILLGLTEHSAYEGSDSDHFKVPDLRGEFLRGSGTNSHSNQGSGGEVGVHQDATEINSVVADAWRIDANNKDSTRDDASNLYWSQRGGSWTDTFFTTRPTNTSVLFCIAYKDIYLTSTELPVGFDERGTEYPVSKYIRSDGKWKPVYRKTLHFDTCPANDTVLISDVEKCLKGYGYQLFDSTVYYHYPYDESPILRWVLNTSTNQVRCVGHRSDSTDFNWTFEYTKTNDEWR